MARWREVYLCRSAGLVKIGCSIFVKARLSAAALLTGEPVELLASFRGGFDMEGRVHAFFDEEWVYGEWFVESPRMMRFVESVQNGDVPELPTHRSRARLETMASQARGNARNRDLRARDIDASLAARKAARPDRRRAAGVRSVEQNWPVK